MRPVERALPTIVAVGVVALVIVIAVAAMSAISPPPSDPKAEQIINETAETLAETDTYRHEISGEITATNGETTASESIRGYRKIDTTAGKYRATIQSPRDTTFYLANRTAYAPCPHSHYASAWYGFDEIPQDYPPQTRLELVLSGVVRSGHVYYDGNETLDDDRVHVVTVKPDTRTYREALSQSVTPDGWQQSPDSFDNVTIRLWVDADTDRLTQLRRFEISSDGGVTVRTRLTVEYQYQPVNITLPETVSSKGLCPRS